MKRLIAVLVVVALVMTGAFAQISFGGFGQAAYGVKGGAGDKDVTTLLQTGWGGIPRYGFTIAGNSDNIGFVVEMKADDGSVVVNEKSYIWWKANDVFKVNFGKVQCDALRGKIGDWSEFRGIMGDMASADNIFTRFWATSGALLEVTPVDGLFIGASFNGNAFNNWGNPAASNEPAKDLILDTLQVGAGYSVDGIGQFRVQYLGKKVDMDGQNNLGADKNKERLEVAFAPAFVDGATIDIGAKIPLGDNKEFKAIVAAGAAFNIDAVGVTTRVDATFTDAGTDVIFWATPAYGLDFATIGMDVKVKVASVKDADTTVGFGVAPWISKGYSNGSVKAGVVLTKDANKDMGWAIPVVLTYYF